MKFYLIYGRLSCPYTQRAIEHAKSKKLRYQFKDIQNITKSHQRTIKSRGHSTVPAIFVSLSKKTPKRYSFVGGSDAFVIL